MSAQTALPLIDLRNVSVALNGRVVLQRLNWQLWPAQHWAVLGDNGSGKSTFLRLVRGELWPAPLDNSCRTYAFDGDVQTTAVGIRERIALVSPELQERYWQQERQLTALKVIQTGFLATDFLQHRLSAAQVRRVKDVIQLVEAESFLHRDVQQLSTGELRRVLIARALVGAPRVLICDEMCDGLDAEARKNVQRALSRVAHGAAQLLVTTHRFEEILPVITHAAVIAHGRIARQGRASDLFSKASRSRPLHTSGGPGTTGSAAQRGSRENGLPLIRIEGAHVYLNRRRVLRSIRWEMRAGQHWAVLGPNGAGKTTFLKLVAGDLHPAAGGRIVRFDLTPKNTLWDLRRRIGWVSPEFQAQYRERLTAAEVVASGFFSSVGLMDHITSSQRKRVRHVMHSLGIDPLAERSALELSYGEFRKLLLARALVHRPRVVICDEPFDGLDIGSRAEMRRHLDQVAADGASLLVVTHHPADLPSCMTHALWLKDGCIVSSGAHRVAE